MLQVPATVHPAGPGGEDAWAVHLIDLSRSGVAFASDRPLRDAQPIRVSFRLPGMDALYDADGSVVYCMAFAGTGRYRVGVRFAPLGQPIREAIMDFVTEPMARREPAHSTGAA